MSDVNDLIDQIKSDNVEVCYAAWNTAGAAGAEAIAPLADLMASKQHEVAKAAKESIDRIVHFAGRPYAQHSAREVAAALIKVAEGTHRHRIVRVESLNWIGYVGDRESVPALAQLLSDSVVREDARMALERIPGDESLAALRQAAETAPADFKPNLQQSLYNRQLTPKSVGASPDAA